MKPIKFKPVEIQEPIDFESLAESYKKENWKWWHCGVPAADKIREDIENKKLAISETNHLSSGGITLKLELEKFHIFIHGRLARHYKHYPISI